MLSLSLTLSRTPALTLPRPPPPPCSIIPGQSTVEQYMYGHQKHAVSLYASIVMFMTIVLVGVMFGKTTIDLVFGLFYGSFDDGTDPNGTVLGARK